MKSRRYARLGLLMTGLLVLAFAFRFQGFSPESLQGQVAGDIDSARLHAEDPAAAGVVPFADLAHGHAGPDLSDPVPILEASSLAELLELQPDAVAEAEQGFEALLQRLKGGEDAAARDFSFRWETCRKFLRNDTFRRLVHYGSEDRLLANVGDWVTGQGLINKWRDSLRENLKDLREQMPECLPYYEHATAQLRAELERLAEQGNVAARAVYALWPPHRDLTYATIEEQRYWEVRALEFSLANLEAGEHLGFEVFAKSFGQSTYFTPAHDVTGAFFQVAILRCGFEVSQDRRLQLINFASRRGFDTMPSILAEILLDGSRGLRRYCRSGTWWERNRTMEYLLGLSAS